VEVINAATSRPKPDAPPAPVTPRAERLARQEPATAQWTLIRQLATGGVLVGGLALTYMLIMGGKSDKPTVPSQTADGPLVPKASDAPKMLAETTQSLKPVVVPTQPSDANGIADVGPPLDFNPERDWKHTGDAAAPTHVQIAEAPKPEPNPVAPRTPVENVRIENSAVPRDDGFESRGRIGPNASAGTAPAPRYEETRPETFMYRPMNYPRSDERFGSAPNNNPAPLRR
jgi:hypothetical protein